MFALFMQTMRPDSQTTILDIGTSAEETPEANFLQKAYPWPSRITCTSHAGGAAIRASYPDMHYVQLKDTLHLPFQDQEFDIAYSNAVLEHVGGAERRKAFFREALRVARSLFVLVPNRWFPVEHHTGIPLLHWSPMLFRKFLSGGTKDFWSRAENLEFLSKRLLASEWEAPRQPIFRYTGIPLGFFSSNIAMIVLASTDR